MKTLKMIAATALMLLIFSSFASADTKTLTLKSAKGEILTMPVLEEKECEDCLPFDLGAIFLEVRMDALNVQVDLSDMIKPEAEVNDQIPGGITPHVQDARLNLAPMIKPEADADDLPDWFK